MAVVRWNPSRDFANVERQFNDIFNTFGKSFGGRSHDGGCEVAANWRPLTDVVEENDRYILRSDLPGVDSKDVKITLKDGTLTISGERKKVEESDTGRIHRVERSYGSFRRSFTLPEKVQNDNIKASFNNGQLEVTIPKAEEAKPREIEISLN